MGRYRRHALPDLHAILPIIQPMKVLSLLLLVSFVLAGITENYYDILGVPHSATEDQIRKAFKKLSLKYHPDRNIADRQNAQKLYAKITTAYEVLTDPDKRRVYDRGGEVGVSEFEQQKANQKSYEEMYGAHWKPRKQVYESLYTGTEVIELEMDNISKLFRRNLIWIVNFYHPNCGHCVTFKEEYISIAQKLAGIVVLGAVNCSANEELCEEYNVQSYPSLIYFPENTAAEHEAYTGNRDYAGIADFAVARMQSFVRLVRGDSFQEFLDSEPNRLKILLFTSRKTTPPIFKVISKEFKEKVLIGEIRSTDNTLPARFNITDFPTVLALTSLSDPEIYTGEGKVDQLSAWIRSFEGKSFEKPLVRELTRSLQKHGHCNKQDPTICILWFADSPTDPGILEMRDVAKDFVKDKVSFFWVNKGKYREFYEGFGETRGVIYKTKRMKFMAYAQVQELKNALAMVLSGGGSFDKLLMSPELNEVKIDL